MTNLTPQIEQRLQENSFSNEWAIVRIDDGSIEQGGFDTEDQAKEWWEKNKVAYNPSYLGVYFQIQEVKALRENDVREILQEALEEKKTLKFLIPLANEE